MGIGAGVSE